MKNRLKLAVFDIDGTLRRMPCPWSHLHSCLGMLAKGRGFAENYARGDISYHQWAKLDASLWKGASRTDITLALASNPLREGVRELSHWLKVHAVYLVAISTGLSIFNNITAQVLGFDKCISNDLIFENDICTGDVVINVSEDDKDVVFDQLLMELGIDAASVVAFGDGEADIPLLRKASLGMAVYSVNDAVSRVADFVVSEEPIHEPIIRAIMDHFTV